MTQLELVDDLITLQELAEREDDPVRRQSIDSVRDHLAERDAGTKVSEAARVLGVSAPTVRSWIEAGVLRPVGDIRPVRIDLLSLAAVKRVVDLLRRHSDDRYLLADVARLLRDEALLAGEDVHSGLSDVSAGRTVPLGDDLSYEITKVQARGRPDPRRVDHHGQSPDSRASGPAAQRCSASAW